MPFEVYDFREEKDIRNLLVTPQIRSRFLRMAVGQVNGWHSHDLGHEIFLILQGQAEFEMIEGDKHVLGPGQLCIALTDEQHIVRNVGDDEVIMYLSVSPHIHPTHTYWIDDVTKMRRPRFEPYKAYDVESDDNTTVFDLADRHLKATEELTQIVQETVQVQQTQVAAFEEAVAAGDPGAILDARDAMWEAMYTMYKTVHEATQVWNDFTARIMEDC